MMVRFDTPPPARCDLVFGPLSSICERLGGRKAAVVTDDNVLRFHADSFPPVGPVFSIRPGEGSKTMETAARIHRWLAGLEMDRGGIVVGIGGGVVTDLAGFAAATYMRGIAFGLAPTTLLAQVDAAIGGKSGVNVDGYKNLAGVFRQPEFIVADPRPLGSLPDAERRCGLAEMIKSALVGDRDLFSAMEADPDAFTGAVGKELIEGIRRAASVKLRIVVEDEREMGRRKVLNLGHTLAHALERATKIPHGEAVAVGLAFAARLSRRLGSLCESDEARIVDLLRAFGLPVATGIAPGVLMEGVRRDKKRSGAAIDFALLESVGSAFVRGIDLRDIEEALDDLR